MTSSPRITLTLQSPHDFHCHVRDNEYMASVAPALARQFRRAIIMPNLVPPVTTTQHAIEYRQRLLQHTTPVNPAFEPLMTLYLTDVTTVAEIHRAKASGVVYAVKLYPAGATTNSDSGVTDITKVYHVLDAMAEVGMPLLVHGEVTDAEVDIFDREAVFLQRVMRPLVERCPHLKIVMEHITTAEAVAFVSSAPANVAATITAHHLLYNRSRIFQRGLNPHYYCLPVLKTQQDQQALVTAAISGDGKFFAGTDSAPHPQGRKESCCGSAGCYTSFAAVELYTEVFAKHHALDKLSAFLCENGARFYGLQWNAAPVMEVTVTESSWQVPDSYPFGDTIVVPLRAGEDILFQQQQQQQQ